MYGTLDTAMVSIAELIALRRDGSTMRQSSSKEIEADSSEPHQHGMFSMKELIEIEREREREKVTISCDYSQMLKHLKKKNSSSLPIL